MLLPRTRGGFESNAENGLSRLAGINLARVKKKGTGG